MKRALRLSTVLKGFWGSFSTIIISFYNQVSEELGQMKRLNSSKKQFIVSPIQLKINQYRSMVYTGPAWQKLWRQGTLSSVDKSGEFIRNFSSSSPMIKADIGSGQEKYTANVSFFPLFLLSKVFFPHCWFYPALSLAIWSPRICHIYNNVDAFGSVSDDDDGNKNVPPLKKRQEQQHCMWMTNTLRPPPHVFGYFENEHFYFPFSKKLVHTQHIQIVFARPHENAKKTEILQHPSRSMRYVVYDLWHHRIRKPPFLSGYTKTIGRQFKFPLWEPFSWTFVLVPINAICLWTEG